MCVQVTDSTPVSSVTWIKVGQTSVYSTQPAITVVSIVVTIIIIIINHDNNDDDHVRGPTTPATSSARP